MDDYSSEGPQKRALLDSCPELSQGWHRRPQRAALYAKVAARAVTTGCQRATVASSPVKSRKRNPEVTSYPSSTSRRTCFGVTVNTAWPCSAASSASYAAMSHLT